ncbi:uncharacterized protein RHOBADRAFT_55976 [Rhodotorula graminis WP1]|uniref:RRM domain-containing protein n=1 Tax=Rhodotorula graminis (strain WP1) TaxID=578459 RepID=A0A0P9ES05_RHOGW|nr:uncharacterized protein RHOBADRAFT_55976 [Rhodotorula graminis WP1]KPV72137.1 hypothetical protein RHOBADRAFT_55976 [Rhodotorula graminis WP1]
MSDAPAPERRLTKKEKKAQAFRAQKASKKAKAAAPSFDDEVQAIDDGEQLSLDQLERQPPVAAAAAANKSKKRARDDDGEGGEDKGEGEGEVGAAAEGDEPKKKKRQRGKTQAQRDREAREAAKGAGGADGAHRLLLFVGNMPYKVTVDEIKEHFKPCGEVPAVRLLTPKTAPSPSSSSSATTTPVAPASKGCAFLDFTSATALQSALRLHHSTLSHRKINVELTAGGGGNSAARKLKIDEQRKKLTAEREKATKNKRLREGESENGDKTGRWKLAAEKKAAAAEEEGAGAAAAAAVVGEGGAPAPDAAAGDKPKKKVRDRRQQKDGGGAGAAKQEAQRQQQQQKLVARAVKASTGANAIKIASGWGDKGKA